LNVSLNPLGKNPARPPILDRPQLAGDDQHANLALPIVRQLCQATVYQRGVKIISVAEFSIMIITLALCACRDTAWVLSTPSKATKR
jgi:hypothetical protein